MQYKFNTESVQHGKASLILYAMYKSKEKNSALTGMETWNRVKSFIRASVIKSKTTAEFVENFCKKAKIDSVKPKYLKTDNLFINNETGEIIESDWMKNYKTEIFSDNSLLKLFEKESMYLIILVRERLEREKLGGLENEEDTDEI